MLVMPRRAEEALRLIAAAAKQGDGEALHLSAVFAAAGVDGKPDWHAAIVRLGRAKAAGDVRAKQQIAVLGPNFFAKPFIKAPPARMRFENRRVGVIEGFLPAAMCDWIPAKALSRTSTL